MGIRLKTTQKQVYHLWDELLTIPPSASEQALMRLLDVITGWIGADQARWVAMLRSPPADPEPEDSLRAWRVCASRSLHPYTKAQIALLKSAHRQTLDEGDTTRALQEAAGTYRTHRLHDGLIAFDSFRRTPYYRVHFKNFGVVDRLWSICPVGEDAEAYFFFDLIDTRRRFSQEDADIIATALRPLGWLQRQLFLGHGFLGANKPLTRTQRRIVHLLLTGKSEREIATEARQNLVTTHKHIETIYRVFGVGSRAALMALWFSGG